jgi:hypothetical protein
MSPQRPSRSWSYGWTAVTLLLVAVVVVIAVAVIRLFASAGP